MISKCHKMVFILTFFIMGFVNMPSSLAINADSYYGYSPRNNLTFYFQRIDIRALLQLIAKDSGLNFVISDAVQGNITLNLKNVTWKEAFDIVLRSSGLASRRSGNVVFISTLEEMTSNSQKQLQSAEDMANLAPLSSAIIQLKYTNAEELAKILKGSTGSLLTPRGQVAVDIRTNSIIIRDTRATIADIRHTIRKIDIPAKQVLIEARIVNIDCDYEEQIGVRFGLSDTRHLSGTLDAANQLAQGVNAADVTPFTQRLNFDIPASRIFDGVRPGSIGLALAHLGPVLLDLELSALEGERHAEVIARPRVVTSNQQKAMIQTGEEIPYQESTSSGATSVTFKKAVLSLTIIPQITPNNKIVLDIRATEDSRGQSITVGTTTVPAINTQEVQSKVLLNDNETIVIGGVYKQTKIKTIDRIPFFGSLPVVGYLFRHKGESNEKRELLIFITPKIITSSNIQPVLGPSNAFYKGENE
jgi:type IV pilus assembly protein PilQ